MTILLLHSVYENITQQVIVMLFVHRVHLDNSDNIDFLVNIVAYAVTSIG